MKIDDKPVIIWLNTHLSLLSHLQQRMFTLRYGLNGEKRHTWTEIEEELMLTRGEVRAEEAEVLKIAIRDIKKRN
jgi:DNA-directed RNA polymerase sigma subunit (sigma70/sigma32)